MSPFLLSQPPLGHVPPSLLYIFVDSYYPSRMCVILHKPRRYTFPSHETSLHNVLHLVFQSLSKRSGTSSRQCRELPQSLSQLHKTSAFGYPVLWVPSPLSMDFRVGFRLLAIANKATANCPVNVSCQSVSAARVRQHTDVRRVLTIAQWPSL